MTGWRYARRASAERICFAHAASARCVCGTADEDAPAARRIARPGRVKRTGDRQAFECAAVPTSRSCRPNCEGNAAAGRAAQSAVPERKATVTTCGPAFTGTRTRKPRIHGISGIGRLLEQALPDPPARRSPPACTRSPSTANSTSCADSRPRMMFKIRPVQLRLKHVFAIERKVVTDLRCRRWFPAAVLRCADPARRPAGCDRFRCSALTRGSPTASAPIFIAAET